MSVQTEFFEWLQANAEVRPSVYITVTNKEICVFVGIGLGSSRWNFHAREKTLDEALTQVKIKALEKVERWAS